MLMFIQGKWKSVLQERPEVYDCIYEAVRNVLTHREIDPKGLHQVLKRLLPKQKQS